MEVNMRKFWFYFIGIFLVGLISGSYPYAQPVVSYKDVEIKGKIITFNPQKVRVWVQKLISKDATRKNLSKEDIKRLAVQFELTKSTNTNPHLKYKEGDVSFWYKHHVEYGVNEDDLKLEFAARKAVLEAADDMKVIIDTQGDLSHAAQQIMADMLRAKEHLIQSSKGNR
jgi:hypothetical protein